MSKNKDQKDKNQKKEKQKKPTLSLLEQYFIVSLPGTQVAEVLTIPFETSRTLLMSEGTSKHYNGMLSCLRYIYRTKGFFSLFPGVTPGLVRQVLYGGIRLTLYKPFLRKLMKKDDITNTPFLPKVFAATVTGGFAISIAHPADMIKTKLQYQLKNPHLPKQYKGITDCFLKIYAKYGITNGLWKGYKANLLRNSIMNPVEVVAFFGSQQFLLQNGIMNEGIPLYLLCGTIAGINGLIFGNPFDVIKTIQITSGGKLNLFGCIKRIIKTRGLLGFYYGMNSNIWRVAGWNAINFTIYQKIENDYIAYKQRKIDELVGH